MACRSAGSTRWAPVAVRRPPPSVRNPLGWQVVAIDRLPPPRQLVCEACHQGVTGCGEVSPVRTFSSRCIGLSMHPGTQAGPWWRDRCRHRQVRVVVLRRSAEHPMSATGSVRRSSGGRSMRRRPFPSNLHRWPGRSSAPVRSSSDRAPPRARRWPSSASSPPRWLTSSTCRPLPTHQPGRPKSWPTSSSMSVDHRRERGSSKMITTMKRKPWRIGSVGSCEPWRRAVIALEHPASPRRCEISPSARCQFEARSSDSPPVRECPGRRRPDPTSVTSVAVPHRSRA